MGTEMKLKRQKTPTYSYLFILLQQGLHFFSQVVNTFPWVNFFLAILPLAEANKLIPLFR